MTNITYETFVNFGQENKQNPAEFSRGPITQVHVINHKQAKLATSVLCFLDLCLRLWLKKKCTVQLNRVSSTHLKRSTCNYGVFHDSLAFVKVS